MIKLCYYFRNIILTSSSRFPIEVVLAYKDLEGYDELPIRISVKELKRFCLKQYVFILPPEMKTLPFHPKP